jgi:hypothetical protein
LENKYLTRYTLVCYNGFEVEGNPPKGELKGEHDMARQIAVGMKWHIDWHTYEVTKMFKNGKVQITETWIAEDSGKECKSVKNYNVSEDEHGQFAWQDKYKEYAFNENEENGYVWWARTYACGADNANEFSDEEIKEENKMMTRFELNGTIYESNDKGNYFYKSTGKTDKQGNPVMMRISQKIWNEAWEQSGEAERQAREAKQAKADKEAEKAFNKTKKTVKKSKNIAFELDGVTLTKKQVQFIKRMPEDDFYEHGLDSTLWIDVYCDTIADEFNPMAVGAMVSTLAEKHLVVVSRERVNGKISKYMSFTEAGKKIAKALGLN